MDVYYVASMLDKLRLLSNREAALVADRHVDETTRLQAAMVGVSQADQGLVTGANQLENQAQTAAQNARNMMAQFYYTIKQALGSQAGAPSCALLKCGAHAQCITSASSSKCVCWPSYEGDGLTCRPKMSFAAKVVPVQSTSPVRVAEVRLAAFAGGHVAVAIRDNGRQGQGVMLLGRLTASEDILWGSTVPFSSGAAYGISLVTLASGRWAVSFRDKETSGTLFVVAGDTDMRQLVHPTVTVQGQPYQVASKQSTAAVLVPLPSSQVACFFADTIVLRKGDSPADIGSAMLLDVPTSGAISLVGKYRFANVPVANLAAAMLTSDSFVVAYRGQPPNAQEGDESEEAAVLWAALRDGELVVSPNTLFVEPNITDITERDLSVVSAHTFAYTYFSASEGKTKTAIVHVDPLSHQMTLAGKPATIAPGKTSFVHAVSHPYGSSSPHLFAYLQPRGGSDHGVSCRVSEGGQVVGCKDVALADAPVTAASAAAVWDGRMLYVYGDPTAGVLTSRNIVLYPSDPPPGLQATAQR